MAAVWEATVGEDVHLFRSGWGLIFVGALLCRQPLGGWRAVGGEVNCRAAPKRRGQGQGREVPGRLLAAPQKAGAVRGAARGSRRAAPGAPRCTARGALAGKVAAATGDSSSWGECGRQGWRGDVSCRGEGRVPARRPSWAAGALRGYGLTTLLFVPSSFGACNCGDLA